MGGCEFCGMPIERLHHPTGKDEHGVYFDLEFRRGLCHNHHEFVHDDLHTLDLADPDKPVVASGHSEQLTWFDRVEKRLRRWASYLARLDAAATVPTVYAIPALVLVRWADELARGTRRLDERYPGWRRDRGFYPE